SFDVLRAKPQSVPSLIASGILPEHELKRVIYALVITRHLDLGSGPLPIGVDTQSITPPVDVASFERQSVTPEMRSKPAPARPASLPPENRPSRAPAVAPEVEAFRQEIRSRAEKIGSQNYYQILGIAQD